jgi:serine protease
VPVRKIISTPNDVSYPSQWSLDKIKAPQAWDENPGGSPVIVAVVDNAVQTTHVDLAANMVGGKDMSSDTDFDPNPPNDTFNHGTHVAGIVSAVTNNSIGIAGAANNKVKIMPIKATPDGGNPNSIYYGFEGVTWAVDNGAQIISLSWGGGGYSATEQAVIDYAFNNGVMVVAAAGNDNSEVVSYPAGYNHVISVASLDATDIKSSFSSFGTTVDISAPGRAILSTLPTNVYGSFSGTSMATPLVASCLGYLKSCFPFLNNGEIEELLKSTADDISSQNLVFDGKLGKGRINLLNAVACKNEGLDTLSLLITPTRYFCAGDSVKLYVRPIVGAVFNWYNNGLTLASTVNQIFAKEAGNYSLKIQKGNCIKSAKFNSLVINTSISPQPIVTNSESYYCSGLADTLKIVSASCSFPVSYEKTYAGPEVGYDNFLKSGANPTVNFEGVPGLIDSVQITIAWQKKDGGNANTCSTPDGGATPYNEEVSFELLGPTGKKVNLILAGTYARGTVTSGLVTMIFKTNAPSIINRSLPISGIFKPKDSFNTYNGDIPNGTWTLLPNDDSNIDPLCVSGFSVKIFTDANNSFSQTSWWDNLSGGNLLSSTSNLIKNNLPVGENNFYAQNRCTGLCPSVRTKSEIRIKNVPEIVAFKFSDILISPLQAQEVASAISYNIIKNPNNIYTVSGLNALNQNFSYIISNHGPHLSPVSICDSVSYALLAMGCNGQVVWSNGQSNRGILINNLKANSQITANCVQSWSCPIPPPSSFNFVMSSSPQFITGVLGNNVIQNTFGTQISSSQKILPTSNVNYRASQNILLTPGFKVENGNVFSAQIGNCQN